MALTMAFLPAMAHDITVINHIHEAPPAPEPDVTNVTNINQGISESDLVEAIAIGAAINHQFDFSYSGWQGSINGAFFEGENAVSLGAANRFDFINGALLHGSYTQFQNKPLYTIGGTWRF